MRLPLTRNVNNEYDNVNGMRVTVMDATEHDIRVRTDTHQRLILHPWTNENRNAYYLVRLGYRFTLHKHQGLFFEHILIWLDHFGFEAAEYVASSRVQYDA